MNPYYDRTKPHHTPDGFRDPQATLHKVSLATVLKWRWRAWRQGLPPAAKVPTPVVAPALDRLNAAAGSSATWIGHSSMLVRSGGLNVLTDPVFSHRASPLPYLGPRRAVPPGIAFDDLPPVDVVLISHGHYDHLDRRSIERLAARAPDTLFVAPLGFRPLLNAWGARNVVELDWWQGHVHGGVEFVLTPARHWTARSLGDRNRMLWGAYAVFARDLVWYFSGDSGYGEHFVNTGQRFAHRARNGALFDLALLAIGAYEPRWFMQHHHMNPEDAVRAHRELMARQSIGIHWGTFPLTDEALDEPPRRLIEARRAAGLGDGAFLTLSVGETWWSAATENPAAGL